MSVIKKIEDAIKESMKKKAMDRLSVLRMVKTSLKNKELESSKDNPLTEEQFIAVLSTLVKQRREAAEQYTNVGKQELADKELGEIDIIQEFLPKPLTEEELNQLISKAIGDLGASGMQDMGKIMGALKADTAGKVEGKVLADKVKSALQNI